MMSKYPSTRSSYCRKVGALRESRIFQCLKALLPSYQIPFHSHVSINGVDLPIFHEAKPIAKFEILNEDVSSYIDKKRALSIRKNLKGVPYKGLICSHGNMTREAKKILKNIPILRLGFQTLPKSFHDFYSKMNKVFKRKIANGKSLKLLKNSILSFLIRIGFPLLMYVTNNKYRIESSVPIPFTLEAPLPCSFTMFDGKVSVSPLKFDDGHKQKEKSKKRKKPSHRRRSRRNIENPVIYVSSIGFPLVKVSFCSKCLLYEPQWIRSKGKIRICKWRYELSRLIFEKADFEDKVELWKKMFNHFKVYRFLNGKTIKGKKYVYFKEDDSKKEHKFIHENVNLLKWCNQNEKFHSNKA